MLIGLADDGPELVRAETKRDSIELLQRNGRGVSRSWVGRAYPRATSGASQASLVIFGLAASLGGLALWNGIGEHLASTARPRVIAAVLAASGVMAAVGLATTAG